MINSSYDPKDNFNHLWAKMIWADPLYGYQTFEWVPEGSELLICYHFESLRFRIFSNSDPRIDITPFCSDDFISRAKVEIDHHKASIGVISDIHPG